METLKKQLDFFEKNKAGLLKQYDGLFIVISEDLAVHAFPSDEEAYFFGVKTYGLGHFLMKECRSGALNSVHVIEPQIALA